jgi:hypothetical protein
VQHCPYRRYRPTSIKSPRPKLGILDKILHLFGKERQLVIPDNVYREYGDYVIVQAKYQNFLSALLSKKSNNQKTVEEILAEMEGKNIRM